MAYSQYPREIIHPNGFRTMVVFTIDEERAVNEEHAAWRKEMLEAEARNKRGEAHDGLETIKRGPGRPRKENTHG